MAAASRDRRRTDLAKFVETYRKLDAPAGNAFEQAVWVMLARNGTKEGATRAWNALQARYLDINEIRVAKLSEIAPVISRHVKNDAEDVAWYLRGFLREVMRTQHQMAFEFAEAMTPDQTKKYLQSLENFRQEVAMAMALHFCAAEIEAEAGLEPVEGETKPRKRPEKEVTVAANRLRLLMTCGAYGTVTSTSKEANSARAFAKAWSFGPLKPRPVEEPEPVPVILASDLEESASEAVAARAKKKAAAKRASAKGAPVVKKTKAAAKAPKSKAAKKPVAKKAPAKKAPAKKAVAKKAPARKTVPKKAAAKKVAKKPAAKKAAKKSPAKSSSRSGGGTRPRTARTTRKRSVSKKSSRRS